MQEVLTTGIEKIASLLNENEVKYILISGLRNQFRLEVKLINLSSKTDLFYTCASLQKTIFDVLAIVRGGVSGLDIYWNKRIRNC